MFPFYPLSPVALLPWVGSFGPLSPQTDFASRSKAFGRPFVSVCVGFVVFFSPLDPTRFSPPFSFIVGHSWAVSFCSRARFLLIFFSLLRGCGRDCSRSPPNPQRCPFFPPLKLLTGKFDCQPSPSFRLGAPLLGVVPSTNSFDLRVCLAPTFFRALSFVPTSTPVGLYHV